MSEAAQEGRWPRGEQARHRAPSATGRSHLRLSLRLLWREWRAGELRLLIVSLLIAVGGISSVGFFIDRIERAMESKASELLAADFLVTSRDPIPEHYAEQAEQAGLQTARTLSFRIVVLAGETMRLTQVKAVTSAYPLRGTLRASDRAFGEGEPVTATPAPGTIWLEGRLLAALQLKVGDALALGAARLRIAKVLTYEPDRGGDIFSIAPRVLMNLADVPATQLVQPGSRVRHRLLFAGTRATGDRFRTELKPALPVHLELHTVREGRPQLRRALDRAGQFLGLAALVGVMLAGIAIAISANRHAERSLDTTALLRCLGASQNDVMRIYLIRLMVLALSGGLGGVALGFAAQFGLAALVGGLLVDTLPPPGIEPLFAGLGVALVTLAGFGLPPLIRLRNVPPGRVLRRDLAGTPTPAWTIYLSSALALAGLAWWQAGHFKLAAMVVGGLAGALVVLALGAWALLLLLKLTKTRAGTSARFAIAALTRRPRASIVQAIAFGLGIMVLLLLALVRGELLDEWRTSLPADAPNYFLINIQPADAQAVRQHMAERDMTLTQMVPMIRGRLIARNGIPVSPDDYADPRAARLAAREFNLSYAAERPQHTPLLAGAWWSGEEADPALFSMEEGIGKTLGFELGDRVTFRIAGIDVEGRISNVRKVQWDSFKVNFFFIGHPKLLAEHPAAFATSFHLAEGRTDELVRLVREFPSITVFDIDALMRQVRGIMQHAALGVEYVFGFTVLAGLMVLLATIQSTLDERRQETAILRTLGASRGLLTRTLIAEFALLGGLAGGLAAVTANVTGTIVASEIFKFDLSWQPSMWLIGITAGGVGVAVAGYLGTRKVVLEPPLTTLRQA